MKKKNRFRNKRIYIYVTEEEKEIIKSNMLKVGETKINDFGRLLMMYGAIYSFDTTKLSELAYEVNRVGNNINQIAKKVNQTGNIYKTELDEINTKLDEINEFIEKLYQKNKLINGGK
jgi:methyl-accepting chemotaxis protein